MRKIKHSLFGEGADTKMEGIGLNRKKSERVEEDWRVLERNKRRGSGIEGKGEIGEDRS